MLQAEGDMLGDRREKRGRGWMQQRKGVSVEGGYTCRIRGEIVRFENGRATIQMGQAKGGGGVAST